jgi:hypothetical protein
VIVVLLGAAPAQAADYNLHLVTDNAPDYTDLESFVASSTGAWQSPQDKCIAVWRWGRRSRRQTSCAVENGRHVWDPILHYNSYGVVIAPTDARTSPAVQSATAFWDPGPEVTFEVDLARAESVAGVRICTHQPEARYAHPARIDVAVSGDGKSWQPGGIIQHDELFRPPGDYEAWEHDDSPAYADLPAGGRLAYAYPLVFPQPLVGRYLRVVCTPQPGRGLGLSEIAAYCRVEVHPWPDDIVLLETSPAATR